MKTKYILAALCLPALFTACSNEEFAVENEIGDKPVVKLKLSTTYGTEGMVDTRMVNNNGTFLWDNTDMLGACLLSGDDDNIYSNNQFTNTLTEASAKADFTTASTTVVGKYLFYYNYNPAMTTDVTGVQYSLKEPQEYDPDGTKMMENNFMISPRITVDGKEPGGLTLPLTMRSIYGYGLLNLKLDNAYDASSVNIQKIIISYTSNVHNPGIIDMSAVPSADLSAANLRTLREGSTPDYTGKTDAELTSILLKEADEKLTAYNTTYTSGTILDLTAAKNVSSTASQVSISCISTENPNGIALSKTGEFSTRMLLPTTANSGTNVTIDVYTDKGKYQKKHTGGFRIKAGHTVNLANINRTGSETALTMSSFQSVTEVNAVSEADFIASMAQFSGQATTVNVTVGNFEITPKAIAAVPSGVTLSFQNSATFNGDMILKNMIFAADGTYTMKAGNITLDQAVTFTDGAKVEITGAKVAVGATKNDYAKYTVAGGELNINNVDLNGDPASTTINSIVVTEGGTVNVETPITVTTFTLTKGTVNNNGTISTIAIEKDGALVNKGTVTVISANAGVVDNYKTLTTVTTNSKTINQKDAKAVITNCATNAGTINTASYSQTTVGTNNGEIVYTENARIKVTTNNGNVTYQAPTTIKAEDFSALSAAITKIKFSSDFTYDYGTGKVAQATLQKGIKTLEFSGNLTLSKDWTLNAASTISFVGATANITGQHQVSAETTLAMNVGAAAVPSVSEAVLTDMYIAPGTTITTAQGGLTVTIESGATVWNDGTVNGNGSTPSGWSGNAITNTNS